MGAKELVAALRADHGHSTWNSTRGPEPWCWMCDQMWPCSPIIAADRIEAGLQCADRFTENNVLRETIRAALDGAE